MKEYEEVRDAEVEKKYESPYLAIVSMEKRISDLEKQVLFFERFFNSINKALEDLKYEL